MRLQATRPFERDYARLPNQTKGQVDKQLRLLLTNPQHPSLRLKKVQGTAGIWEARVSRSHRLTLQFAGDTIILRRVGSHDVLREP